MALRPVSLKARALQWLAQRELSRHELRQRLLRLASQARPNDDAASADTDIDEGPAVAATAQAEVDALLDWLSQQAYLSDQRFVESRVHARAPRHGQRRIQHELAQHGLSLDPATRDELARTEWQRACEVWARRYDRPPTDTADRARQLRFLVGRGFSVSTAQRVLHHAGLPPEAESGFNN